MQFKLLFHFMVLTRGNLATSDQQKWKPFGLNMCKELCQRQDHCLAPSFDEVQLSCQLDLDGKTSYSQSKEKNANLCDVRKSNNKALQRSRGEKNAQQNNTDCPQEYVASFHEACREGRLGDVKRLLSRKLVDINCPGKKRVTAVMLAVVYEHIDIFDYLLEQKCDVTAVDSYNDTALHSACSIRSIYFAKTLLNNFKFDINSKGGLGRSPLMFAVKECRTKLVKFLKDRGADIETVDDNNNNVLHVACISLADDIVKYILPLNKIDIDSRGQYGMTPLMFAVKTGYVPLAKLLIGKGANLKAIDDYYNNILHFSCMSTMLKMVEYILSLNTTGLECKGKKKRTPLMVSVENGNVGICKLLLSKGADIKALDAANNNILHVACSSEYLNMVKYVLSLNVSDIDSRGKFGRTPLMIAVERGRTEVVKLLHEQYNASLTTTDDDGSNVLHIACSEGRLYILRYLVTQEKLRGFAKKKNKTGNTPAQLAEMKGHCEIVSFLQARE